MVFLVLVLWAWNVPSAWANGQSSHIWIAENAKTHIEAGVLRDLVTDPALQQALINGAMFPDGGYPLGDPYAEIAHWEPFQNAYRDWIIAEYEAPWTDEAAPHIAFLLGMAAHGIADQLYDSLFMERSRQEDTEDGWGENFDMATDVVTMARLGPVEAPGHWLPARQLVDIYLAQTNHTVSEATLEEGQALLRLAVNAVALMAANPDGVDTFAAEFPWAADHMDDPGQAGSPPGAAALLALYWESVWARLNGDSTALVLASYPPNGGTLHPREVDRVQSRITLVFSEAVHQDSLASSHFVLSAEDGTLVPVNAWLFYRDMSHVVHIAPESDLEADTWYSVAVGAGIRTVDGQTTQGDWSFSFTTGAPAVDSGASITDTAQSLYPTADDAAKPPASDSCGGCTVGQTGGHNWPTGLVLMAFCSVYRRRSWRS